MVAAAALMPDSGSCPAISYAMDTLPASRCSPSGSRTGAIARARVLLSKRRVPFDSFEVWDRARFVPQAYPDRRAAAAE
jgi:hypothetical protein